MAISKTGLVPRDSHASVRDDVGIVPYGLGITTQLVHFAVSNINSNLAAVYELTSQYGMAYNGA